MPPPPHTKPENVLKRAQELIGVGQAQAALSLLHEHVTSKRTRNNPIASIEPVMLLFVELCVDLRKGKAAKDGLYSYKNTAQNTNIGTIELVLSKFIELAEHKVTEAQEKAQEVQTSSSAPAIDDLEAIETPESILLSTVSGEQSQDRTDRAIVTPWLKFLWETYRTVLDILKNNARLETLYQSTAHQAFQFCMKYTRKTEFRRLCELLRNHLQNAAKYQSQIHAINLSDSDTLQRHLDTRFEQLNVATELELWQEAFRSIEDIHTLLNLSKRPAKPLMMANYFDKLSTIFLVGENYLFHAAAYNRYFNLLRGSAAMVAGGQSQKKDNPVVTDADLSRCASFVILSALAIPVISTSRSRGAMFDSDEARKNKHQRLTNLLALPNPPSRASLFKEIQAKGLLKRARPEIRDLYNILEVDFHPLSICQKISPILSQIGSDPNMGKYILPLQQVILTRLFQQLSQVYESVDLNFVLGLAQFPKPFQVSESTIEKFIMNGCKKGDLGIRIDYATGALTFDSDVFSSAKALHPGSGAGSADSDAHSVQRLQSTPAEIIRSQLTRLAKTLFVTCQYVDVSFMQAQRKTCATALERAGAGLEKEHLDNLQRRDVIDKKKQAAASIAAQKKKEEENRSKLKAQELEQAELRRIQEQNRERDSKRQQAIQERIQKAEIETQLKDLQQGKHKIDITNLNLDNLDSQAIRILKLQALEKEKQELSERLRIVGKRNDHLERAFRREEIKHMQGDYEAQRQRDFAEYEKLTAETMQDAEIKHQESVALKRRLTRLVGQYEEFRDQVRTERRVQFEKQRKIAERELQQKKEARIKEYRDRQIRERQEAEARERFEKEEEERIQRELMEKASLDEEKRRKAADDKIKRDAERRVLDEKAALQRQREAEIEAKLAAKKNGRIVPERPAVAPVIERSESSGPPRLPIKSVGGWREREAARLAGQTANIATETPVATAAEEAPSQVPRGSGYLPPHLRTNMSAKVNENLGAGSANESSRSWSRGRREEESTLRTASHGFGSGRAVDRAASPGNAPGIGREYSGRGEVGMERTASPAAPLTAGGSGKYRPGAFRKTQQ